MNTNADPNHKHNPDFVSSLYIDITARGVASSKMWGWTHAVTGTWWLRPSGGLSRTPRQGRATPEVEHLYAF